jgi:hypothetical protein
VYSHARREAIKYSALYLGAPGKMPAIPAIVGHKPAGIKTLTHEAICVDYLRVCYRLLRWSATHPGVVFGFWPFSRLCRVLRSLKGFSRR